MRKKKIAIITGGSGQDGSYLCDFLIKKNYQVISADRRSSRESLWRHEYLNIDKKVVYEDFDLLDENSIFNLFKKYKVDEFYNLAAQSFVESSFKVPLFTSQVNAIAVLRILDIIKNYYPSVKFYQASTSEMFGSSKDKIMNENTKFSPRSPYGVAKLFAHEITKNYRESYGIFACSGILFNHESPLRGENFVTKKIVKELLEVKKGARLYLELGNIYAKRDWGFAGDYVKAMWKMLQLKIPDDYVICSGKTYTVKYFLNLVLKAYGFKYKWTGKGLNETVIETETKKVLVKINERFYRPAEVNYLKGSFLKAQKKLRWKPKYNLNDLISIMINYEVNKNKF